MRVYAYDKLFPAGLHIVAMKTLQCVQRSTIARSDADSYFVPTPEFEQLVRDTNVFHTIKTGKPIKPSYKDVYRDKNGQYRMN